MCLHVSSCVAMMCVCAHVCGTQTLCCVRVIVGNIPIIFWVCMQRLRYVTTQTAPVVRGRLCTECSCLDLLVSPARPSVELSELLSKYCTNVGSRPFIHVFHPRGHITNLLRSKFGPRDPRLPSNSSPQAHAAPHVPVALVLRRPQQQTVRG